MISSGHLDIMTRDDMPKVETIEELIEALCNLLSELGMLVFDPTLINGEGNDTAECLSAICNTASILKGKLDSLTCTLSGILTNSPAYLSFAKSILAHELNTHTFGVLINAINFLSYFQDDLNFIFNQLSSAWLVIESLVHFPNIILKNDYEGLQSLVETWKYIPENKNTYLVGAISSDDFSFGNFSPFEKMMYLFAVNTIVLNARQHVLGKTTQAVQHFLQAQFVVDSVKYSNTGTSVSDKSYIEILNIATEEDFSALVSQLNDYKNLPGEAIHGLQAVIRLFPVEAFYEDGMIKVRVYVGIIN